MMCHYNIKEDILIFFFFGGGGGVFKGPTLCHLG